MRRTDRRTESGEPDNLDDATEMALREGLRAQPLPTVSPDFDARVLAAVHGRSPLWDLFVASLRPALATAAVSTVVTTLLLSPRLTASNPAVAASPPPANVAAQAGIRMSEAIDAGSYVSVQELRRLPPAAHTKPPHSTRG